MSKRLPLMLSAAALVVSVLGSTSAGRAALDAVIPVPLAKRAYLADTAKNAIRVDNIKASRTPTPGMLVPLDASGKLPQSVGAVGPKGDKGEKGEKGDKGSTGPAGLSAYEIVRLEGTTRQTTFPFDVVTVECPGGKKVIGGGASGVPLGGTFYNNIAVESSYPLTDTKWQAVVSVVNPPSSPGNWKAVGYAICANVAS